MLTSRSLSKWLIGRAVGMLPAEHKGRYLEEWTAESVEHPGGRLGRLRYAFSLLLRSAPGLRQELSYRPAGYAWWTVGPRSVRQLVESAVAIVLMVLYAPLLVATAIAIKMSSRGPVVLRQERVGLNRQIFALRKFRTMYIDNTGQRGLTRKQSIDKEPVAGGQPGVYRISDGPRVTPVGRVLRLFSIDELPHLWNVVRGEMSLVGPRLYVPWEAELFPADVERRFSVRPGMTGLWQVSGRGTVDYRTALQIDVYYADNRSLWLDLRIMARTAVVVFNRSHTP